ncbi:hypothetical protein [Rhodopirellula sp. MGV]|uniref:hypothetical protein n=1 Tax=Rhodopirellula sp. MGV TaxID=2023130 RepID=UPI000BD1009B|nr:hypothetical protein [Rhodopirellula sp. MGV]OYP37074.1 hypothetical protein CGZ80_06915 [Rhodopirellula sp. MGV]
MIRALQPDFDFPIDGDGANSFFARLVYLLRWWHSSPDNELTRTNRKQHLEYLHHLKSRIAQELSDAQNAGELAVRPQYYDVIDRFVVPDRNKNASFMLVNTNWDTVADEATRSHLNKTHDGEVYSLHIHGSVDDHRLLYLPSELTKEPYRTPDEDQRIGGIHGSIMRGLEGASRVVIYGLSLSPLDAELLQTLAAGFSNDNLEEVHVVVPDHELVAGRVRLLLDPRKAVKLIGHDINDLSKETVYFPAEVTGNQ